MSDAVLFPIVIAGLILWVAVYIAEIVWNYNQRKENDCNNEETRNDTHAR